MGIRNENIKLKMVEMPKTLERLLAQRLLDEERSFSAWAINAACEYLDIDAAPYVGNRWNGKGHIKKKYKKREPGEAAIEQTN